MPLCERPCQEPGTLVLGHLWRFEVLLRICIYSMCCNERGLSVGLEYRLCNMATIPTSCFDLHGCCIRSCFRAGHLSLSRGLVVRDSPLVSIFLSGTGNMALGVKGQPQHPPLHNIKHCHHHHCYCVFQTPMLFA